MTAHGQSFVAAMPGQGGTQPHRAPSYFSETAATEVERILDLARWAPSVDNCQPWRFELVDDQTVIVRLTVQSEHDLYDYRGGELTFLAGGMLLESIRIAASAHGRECRWSYEQRLGYDHYIRVSLPKSAEVTIDPLLKYLPLRSVDRRPLRLLPLTTEQLELLTAAQGPDLHVEWHSRARERWRLACLAGRAAGVRLTTPEAFLIHQRVLKWERESSPEGIPAAVAGLSRLTIGLTRWAMRDWRRMHFLNRLGGVFLGALQMDYLPAIFAAAFFTIRLKQQVLTTESRTDSLLRAGQSLQRFWLKATQLGLSVQPSMATLVFAHYGTHDLKFTVDPKARRRAVALARASTQCGFDESVIFMGRIGVPRNPAPAVRSARIALHHLIESRAGLVQKKKMSAG